LLRQFDLPYNLKRANLTACPFSFHIKIKNLW
jgi:hypothetical protein